MSIKCVIWDLDNTLWEGVLLEGDPVRLRPKARETLQTLDSWGILHSIASHNDEGMALKTLESFGLREYFVAPQINFQPKPEQIAAVSRSLDLRPDDFAYVDDDPFHRAQVATLLPAVTVLDEIEGFNLPQNPGVRPDPLTAEARTRRHFYQGRLMRQGAEESFAGSRLDFLISCDLRLSIRHADREDIPRLYELISRTNQLNATAQRYDLPEVRAWVGHPWMEVWVGELADRFGEYGLVSAAVVQKEPAPWLLKVLLVSCRAMGRGVGEGALVSVLKEAKIAEQTALLALYRKTPYNQAMRILFASHGFRPSGKRAPALSKDEEEAEPQVTFRRDLTGELPEAPVWLNIQPG